MSILDEIVARRRERLAQEMAAIPLSEIKASAQAAPPPRDFAAALRGDKVRLIAEVKRASPSQGLMIADFDPVALALTYARSGAAAISVLTEPDFFQGSPEHLSAIRQALPDNIGPMYRPRPPLLRKDFLSDPYQVYESRALGADAFLLIVAILERERLKDLLALGQSLGMEALVEVHQEAEVEMALRAGAKVLGINNRDLNTFQMDINVTKRLRPLIPKGCLAVSESGIRTRQDIEELGRLGVNAVLIGEALVTAPDVAAKVRELALTGEGLT